MAAETWLLSALCCCERFEGLYSCVTRTRGFHVHVCLITRDNVYSKQVRLTLMQIHSNSICCLEHSAACDLAGIAL